MDPLPAEVYSAASGARHGPARDRGGRHSRLHADAARGRRGIRVRCVAHWPAAADRSPSLCGAGNNARRRLRRRAASRGPPGSTCVPSRLPTRRRCGATRARAYGDFAAEGGNAELVRARRIARGRRSRRRCPARDGHSTARSRADLRDGDRAGQSPRPPGPRARRALGTRCGHGLAAGPRRSAQRARITFVALKSGLYLGAAPDHVGALEFAGLEHCATTFARPRAPCCDRIDGRVKRRARCRRGCAPRTRATTAASSSSAGMRCRARRGSPGRPRCAPAPASSPSRRAAETPPQSSGRAAGAHRAHADDAARNSTISVAHGGCLAVGPGLGLHRRAERVIDAASEHAGLRVVMRTR